MSDADPQAPSLPRGRVLIDDHGVALRVLHTSDGCIYIATAADEHEGAWVEITPERRDEAHETIFARTETAPQPRPDAALDLDAIGEHAAQVAWDTDLEPREARRVLQRDVPALIAEVERLTRKRDEAALVARYRREQRDRYRVAWHSARRRAQQYRRECDEIHRQAAVLRQAADERALHLQQAQRERDQAIAERDDYQARLKATDRSWSRVAAERDKAHENAARSYARGVVAVCELAKRLAGRHGGDAHVLVAMLEMTDLAPGDERGHAHTDPAATTWDASVPPGGQVCAAEVPSESDGICGFPVETEPCPRHSPEALAAGLDDLKEWRDGQADDALTGPGEDPGPRLSEIRRVMHALGFTLSYEVHSAGGADCRCDDSPEPGDEVPDLAELGDRVAALERALPRAVGMEEHRGLHRRVEHLDEERAGHDRRIAEIEQAGRIVIDLTGADHDLVEQVRRSVRQQQAGGAR